MHCNAIAVLSLLCCGALAQRDPNNPDCNDPLCSAVIECGVFNDASDYTCLEGFETNSCDCQISCQCQNCPMFDLTLNCPFGFAVDSRGCPVSSCNTSPTTTSATTTTTSSCAPCQVGECGLFFPYYRCPRGYVRDRCGCEAAGCQCAGCPVFDNSRMCPSGHRTRRGCPTSICNRPVGPPRPHTPRPHTPRPHYPPSHSYKPRAYKPRHHW